MEHFDTEGLSPEDLSILRALCGGTSETKPTSGLLLEEECELPDSFQPPTFLSLNQMIEALTKVNRAFKRPTVTVALTAANFILPGVQLNNIVWVPPVKSPAAANSSKSKILQIGFSVIVNMVKPITDRNRAYVSKRWAAALATSEGNKGPLLPFVEGDTFKDSYTGDLSNVSRYLSARDVALSLLEPVPVNYPAYMDALRRQVALVYSRAGMTSIEAMYSYVKAPRNAAIYLPTVRTQALAFKRAYEAAKSEVESKHPGAWLYARSIMPEVLAKLSTSDFYDLYYVAVKTAKKTGQLDSVQFVMSERTVSVDRSQIDRALRVQITAGVFGTGEGFEADLGMLGLDVSAAREAIAKIGKRRRRRADSSSEDEEDGDSVTRR